MYEITRHFEERWAERVGEPMPSKEDLYRMIRDETQTICLQKFRRGFTERGRNSTFMALYWLIDPTLDCIVKVHEKGKKLITVMSKKMVKGTQPSKNTAGKIDADGHG